ncbi:MAG: UrcA family protein [Sphingomonas sp.]
MLNTLIALTLLALPAPLTSAQSGQTSQVRQSDLDLARAADRKILDLRIARAIEKVCSNGPGHLTKSTANLHCRVETEARIAPQRSRAVARAERVAQFTAGSR